MSTNNSLVGTSTTSSVVLTASSDDSSQLLLLTTTNGSVSGDNYNQSEVDLYEVPAGVVALLSVFYGLISLFALIGNALVIYVVVVSPRMRTVTNYYIANMAFADVTIALFAIPFQFHAALLQRRVSLIITIQYLQKNQKLDSEKHTKSLTKSRCGLEIYD